MSQPEINAFTTMLLESSWAVVSFKSDYMTSNRQIRMKLKSNCRGKVVVRPVNPTDHHLDANGQNSDSDNSRSRPWYTDLQHKTHSNASYYHLQTRKIST